jgi:hypothetical protein
MIMKTLFGAVAGALALGAVLVSYDLGERHTFSRDAAPMTQMLVGPDGVARPYLVQAGQSVYGQTPYMAQQPFGWSPYGATMMPGAVAPNALAPYGVQPQPQYVNDRVAYTQPTVRRASTTRSYSGERVSKPARSWQKSALLIGGSAGAGAGVGALIGGKKGAGIGALIGGGSAALLDYSKRH